MNAMNAVPMDAMNAVATNASATNASAVNAGVVGAGTVVAKPSLSQQRRGGVFRAGAKGIIGGQLRGQLPTEPRRAGKVGQERECASSAKPEGQIRPAKKESVRPVQI